MRRVKHDESPRRQGEGSDVNALNVKAKVREWKNPRRKRERSKENSRHAMQAQEVEENINQGGAVRKHAPQA